MGPDYLPDLSPLWKGESTDKMAKRGQKQCKSQAGITQVETKAPILTTISNAKTFDPRIECSNSTILQASLNSNSLNCTLARSLYNMMISNPTTTYHSSSRSTSRYRGDLNPTEKPLVSIPNLRSGHLVRRRVASPLVVRNTRVGLLVQPRNLDHRTRVATPGPLNLELRAGHVELGLVDMALVQANVLDAHEVLAGRGLGGDGKLEAVLVVRAPVAVGVGLAAAEPCLHDLEPVARAVVGLDVRGRLGHVHEARAGVLDQLVVEDLEADLVAGLDGVGGRVAGLGADVAAEVVLVKDVGEDGVVRVAVLAHVRVLAALTLAVDKEDVEDVVRIGRRGESRNQKEGLHGG